MHTCSYTLWELQHQAPFLRSHSAWFCYHLRKIVSWVYHSMVAGQAVIRVMLADQLFLRQVLTVQFWLHWNLLCRPAWPQAHSQLPACVSRVLRLKQKAITSCRSTVIFFGSMIFLGLSVRLHYLVREPWGAPILNSPGLGLQVSHTRPGIFLGAGVWTQALKFAQHTRYLLVSSFEHALVGNGWVSLLTRILQVILLSLANLWESEISLHYVFIHTWIVATLLFISFTIVSIFQKHRLNCFLSFVLCAGQHLLSKVRPGTDYSILKKARLVQTVAFMDCREPGAHWIPLWLCKLCFIAVVSMATSLILKSLHSFVFLEFLPQPFGSACGSSFVTLEGWRVLGLE
jgi:hypothetical protein